MVQPNASERPTVADGVRLLLCRVHVAKGPPRPRVLTIMWEGPAGALPDWLSPVCSAAAPSA